MVCRVVQRVTVVPMPPERLVCAADAAHTRRLAAELTLKMRATSTTTTTATPNTYTCTCNT